MPHMPDFHQEMDRLQNHVPGWVSRSLNRLRAERAVWVRAPTGVALIGGGVLGFLPLPIVSIWMLPVGLALLAHDVPMMRGPMARVLHFTNGKIEKLKKMSVTGPKLTRQEKPPRKAAKKSGPLNTR